MAPSRSSLSILYLAFSVLLSWVFVTALLKKSEPSSLSDTRSSIWYKESIGKLAKDDYGFQNVDAWHDGFARQKPSTGTLSNEQSDYLDSDLDKRIDLFSTRASRKLKKKGQQFQCWLEGAPGVPATKFSQFTDLAKWGWTLDRQNDKDYEHVAKWLNTAPGIDVGDMMHGVGMNWKHSAEIKGGDKTYPPTNAIYNNVFYPSTPSGGIILANDNESPDYVIQKQLTPGTFTSDTPRIPLKSWSDNIFISWASLTTPDQRKNLRFVLRRVITNDATLDNLKKIMKAKVFMDGQAPVWPGVVVDADTNGWYLLLASPNVSGVCWLLVQHQAELGTKVIKGIRVFNEYPKGSYGPSMVIELADKDTSALWRRHVDNGNLGMT